MAGKVTLVGAGPGDPGLLTVKGRRALESAEVVVYDRLVGPEVLALIPETARAIDVGKEASRHLIPQEQINDILLREGLAGHNVVRLKGGDPFVFGRGGEEAIALQAAGVPFEVVPGVTSAIAIPALAGVPVTHRGLSRSVHIVTAHTADAPDGLPPDLDRLAQLSGTLVFLMGLSRLEDIAARLLSAGKRVDTPAAVLSGGNAPHPATVRGTLEDIAEKTRAANIRSPAVIVVGDVAALELAST